MKSVIVALLSCLIIVGCANELLEGNNHDSLEYTHLDYLYESAIEKSKAPESYNEALSLFNFILERDECYCYYGAYSYIAQILIKQGNRQEAKNLLLRAYNKYSESQKSVYICGSISNIRKNLFPEDFSEDELNTISAMVYEQAPSIVGGENRIYEELIYPEELKGLNIVDTVFVSVCINVCGNACQVRLRKASKWRQLNEEAKRIMRSLEWRPAMHRDKYIGIVFTKKIIFSEQESTDL